MKKKHNLLLTDEKKEWSNRVFEWGEYWIRSNVSVVVIESVVCIKDREMFWWI